MIRTRMNRADWATMVVLAIIWGGAFFFIGVAVLSRTRKRVFGDPQLDIAPVSGSAKGLAAVALVCWLGAIIAGRLLAYVGPVSGLTP